MLEPKIAPAQTEMTPQQRQAIAKAKARLRLQQQGAAPQPAPAQPANAAQAADPLAPRNTSGYDRDAVEQGIQDAAYTNEMQQLGIIKRGSDLLTAPQAQPKTPARYGFKWEKRGNDWVEVGANYEQPNQLERFAGDVGRAVAAPFQQNENLRTIAGAPLNLGDGLARGTANVINNVSAVGTEAANAGLNQLDPSRQQFTAPRIEVPQNVIVGEGGVLNSEAGVVPNMVGQIAAARVPLGTVSRGGGIANLAAKDAAAMALTTDAQTPRVSDMIPRTGLGAALDPLRSGENDPTIVSMMKNLGEDLIFSGAGEAVLAGGAKAMEAGRKLLPQAPVAPNAGGANLGSPRPMPTQTPANALASPPAPAQAASGNVPVARYANDPEFVAFAQSRAAQLAGKGVNGPEFYLSNPEYWHSTREAYLKSKLDAARQRINAAGDSGDKAALDAAYEESDALRKQIAAEGQQLVDEYRAQAASAAQPSVVPQPTVSQAGTAGTGQQAGAGVGAGGGGAVPPAGPATLQATPRNVPVAVGKEELAVQRDTLKAVSRFMRGARIPRNVVNDYTASLLSRYEPLKSERYSLAFFVEDDLPQYLQSRGYTPAEARNYAGDTTAKLQGWGRAANSFNESGNSARYLIQDVIHRLTTSQKSELEGTFKAVLGDETLMGRSDEIGALMRQNGEEAYNNSISEANRLIKEGKASQEQVRAAQEINAILTNAGFKEFYPQSLTIEATTRGKTVDELIQERLAADPIDTAHWLQSEIGQAARDAKNIDGSQTNMSRAYETMRRAILDRLEKFDGYKGARMQHGDLFGADEAVSFGDRFLTAARSEFKTDQMARELEKLSPRQQAVAALSIRDAMLNPLLRGSPEDAAARITELQKEGTLKALVTVLGEERGTELRNAIANMRVENQRISAISQAAGSNTHLNQQGARDAIDNIRSPGNRLVHGAGNPTGWGVAGIASMAMGNPLPLVAKAVASAVDKASTPGARFQSRATKGLYGLPEAVDDAAGAVPPNANALASPPPSGGPTPFGGAGGGNTTGNALSRPPPRTRAQRPPPTVDEWARRIETDQNELQRLLKQYDQIDRADPNVDDLMRANLAKQKNARRRIAEKTKKMEAARAAQPEPEPAVPNAPQIAPANAFNAEPQAAAQAAPSGNAFNGKRALPGETSNASPAVTGALIGGTAGYVASDGDPYATAAGAFGGGALGNRLGRPRPTPKPPVPKAPVVADVPRPVEPGPAPSIASADLRPAVAKNVTTFKPQKPGIPKIGQTQNIASVTTKDGRQYDVTAEVFKNGEKVVMSPSWPSNIAEDLEASIKHQQSNIRAQERGMSLANEAPRAPDWAQQNAAEWADVQRQVGERFLGLIQSNPAPVHILALVDGIDMNSLGSMIEARMPRGSQLLRSVDNGEFAVANRRWMRDNPQEFQRWEKEFPKYNQNLGVRPPPADWASEKPAATSATSSVTPLKPAPKPPTRQGMGSSKLPMDEAAKTWQRQQWQAEKGPVDDKVWFHWGSPLSEIDPAKNQLGLHVGSKRAALDRRKDKAIPNNQSKEQLSELATRGDFAQTPDMDQWTAADYVDSRTYEAGLSPDARWFDSRFPDLWNELDAVAKSNPTQEKWAEAVRDATTKRGLSGWQYSNTVEDINQPSRIIMDPTAARRTDAKFDPAESSSSKLLAGLGGPSGAGAAGGGILGYATARDANDDGVVDAQERANGAIGGAVSLGIGGAVAGKAFGARAAGKASGVQAQGFGAGRPKPPPNRLAVPKQLAASLNKSKVSPPLREKLSANAALPPGERKSIMEATGWDNEILRIAAPFIREGTRMDTEIGAKVAALIKQANANPIEYALRQTMAKGAYEEAQKRFKQASGARSRAATNLENLRTRNMLNPNQPAVKQQLSVHKQRRDDAEQFLSEAARLRDEAKVLLDRADIEMMSLKQVRDYANAEIQRITDALGANRPNTKGTAMLPAYNPMGKPKPGPINPAGAKPNKQAAEELAHMLFEADQAELFAKLQAGDITPQNRKALGMAASYYARHPLAAVATAAVAGVTGAGALSVYADQKKRSEDVREVARQRQAEPERPGFKWDWNAQSKKRDFVVTLQSALNDLGYEIGSVDGSMIRADGKQTKTQKALEHFLWSLDNTRVPGSPVTEDDWKAIEREALAARRKRA